MLHKNCGILPKKMPRGSLSLAHADDPPCDARHNSFYPGENSVRLTFHLLRISHIRNSVRPTFHLLRIFHIRCLMPDGRGRRFNFPGQTYSDPLIALTRRASATDNSDSPYILASQTFAIRRIHFRPQ